jgi:hypothetical protein
MIASKQSRYLFAVDNPRGDGRRVEEVQLTGRMLNAERSHHFGKAVQVTSTPDATRNRG